jgi:hypothetical protein
MVFATQEGDITPGSIVQHRTRPDTEAPVHRYTVTRLSCSTAQTNRIQHPTQILVQTRQARPGSKRTTVTSSLSTSRSTSKMPRHAYRQWSKHVARSWPRGTSKSGQNFMIILITLRAAVELLIRRALQTRTKSSLRASGSSSERTAASSSKHQVSRTSVVVTTGPCSCFTSQATITLSKPHPRWPR